ncbi:hypothetical protein QYE76_035289 [Lolium multiflorum]|uniref:DUF4220 domain-containing protein n=1 Tax=Lolium multiflorum TaxID=4521 RepID=A0AAD8VNB3_LOLMU|nr:hypothetical protein QYE76_035289 [Lolium multiflorum]
MDLQSLRRFWGEWEIRVLLIVSLWLQIFLLLAGGLRKRSVTTWLRMLLWLAYLLADSIAIYSLGNLSQNQKHSGSLDQEMHLLAFWAPFLILHLGGQDTITAFAIEDNELWLRHLLSLVSQVALAVYVYWKSRPTGAGLLIPAIIMFVSGVIKYGERTWALKSASMSSFRSSLLTPPDAGPSYAKFLEMYQSAIDSGLHAHIVIVPEEPCDGSVQVEEERIRYRDLVYTSYKFFETFRRLFVDLILSFQDRADSLAFFRKLKMDQAFKVVEIELMLMYESFHSKCVVIHGPVGRILRVFTLAAPAVSLVVFAAWEDKRGYKKVDIVISYVLLGGAFLLETYAILLMIVSPWSYVYMRDKHGDGWSARADKLFGWLSFFQPERRPRWSNQMAQYNLLTYCLKDKPRWYTRAMEELEWKHNIRLKTMWDSFWYTNHTDVSLVLKNLIFQQLKEKANSTSDPLSYRQFGEHRGQWILQRNGCYQQLGWSVELEFDESMLLWHIATDLCYYGERRDNHDFSESDGATSGGCFWSYEDFDGLWSFIEVEYRPLQSLSKQISNYMLFLLVMRPFMMTATIGQIRFGDTCAEAKTFFHRGADDDLTEVQGAEMLSAVQTNNIRPRDVKGDRSKSVLFDACRLAEVLRSLHPQAKRWRVISGVWVEMLCYAAGKCRGNFHAKQLSQGGELLTVVWLLMAHFGIGEQYRVESGHARTKIVIET